MLKGDACCDWPVDVQLPTSDPLESPCKGPVRSSSPDSKGLAGRNHRVENHCLSILLNIQERWMLKRHLRGCTTLMALRIEKSCDGIGSITLAGLTWWYCPLHRLPVFMPFTSDWICRIHAGGPFKHQVHEVPQMRILFYPLSAQPSCIYIPHIDGPESR